MKKLILLIFVVAASLNAQAVQGQIGQVPVVAAADNSPVGGAGNLTTVGSVPYVSASGILNQDAADFFWNATNNRLGIGTATPSQSLEVSGGAIIASGYGNRAAATGPALEIGWTGTTTILQSYNRTTSLYVPAQYSALNHSFDTSGSARMTILGGGNVGIGTTTPAALLTVGTAVGSPATNGNAVIINAANTTLSSRGGNLQVITTNSSAVDVGGSIGLGGQYNTLANSVEFASIAGRKENSTVTNFAGYLQFITTADGVAPTEKMRITSAGNVGIGTAIPGYKLEVAGSSNTEIARVGDGTRSFGISTYTPNSGGVTFKNSGTGLISLTAANAVLIGTGYAGLGSGVPANTVAIEGNVGIGTTTPVYALDVARSGVSGTFRAYDQTATTGSTFAVFRAGVAQSGNVLEVQNNAGSNVLSISATGGLTSAVSITAGGNVNAGATQDLGWSTRSTMTSPSGGVIALYNNAQTDFNRLQFGGTTSSFPSIQRSTTKLFFRLADDSAGATVRAGGYESSDGTAGATVTTCTGFKNGLCISGT